MIREELPPISLAGPDRHRLETLARHAMNEGHPVGGFLLAEVQRATICGENDLPPNVVRVNNWVTFRVDWGFPSESRMLVYPEEYRNAEAQLSVLSPLGAALVGLRAGSRMPYFSIEGMLHVATAESLDPPIGLLSLLRLPAPPRDAAEAFFDSDDPGPAAA
ncbi:MAG: GreA/GreB family elongation factor [Pseudorhodoplanes sp.]